MNVVFFLLGNTPQTKFYVRCFGTLINLHRWCKQEETVHTTYADGTDSVLKRRHIKFRARRVTQKKEYNVHNNPLRQ